VLVYRIFGFDPAARASEPGTPDYLHRAAQGNQRLDNPSIYDMWCYSLSPAGAVAEVFGDLPVWSDEMFPTPYLPGGRRDLGIFEIADDLRIIDMDDPRTLIERGIRPTQVVARNASVTQAWAQGIFEETNDVGAQRWDGIRWWSFWGARWINIGLWVPRDSGVRHTLVNVEQLDLHHYAVESARRTLKRPTR
jgi:hypothetical protein